MSTVPSQSGFKSTCVSVLNAAGRLNDAAYKFAGFCLLALVATTATLVLVRYGLEKSSIAVQEFAMYLHAMLLSLGLAGALQRDGHVRIDIFYRRWSAQGRARANRLGVLLLAVPFALFTLWACIDYVVVAWERQESSSEPGGLPWLWLLKSLLLIYPAQLFLAALALAWQQPKESTEARSA